jgi:hypothetical protein
MVATWVTYELEYEEDAGAGGSWRDRKGEIEFKGAAPPLRPGQRILLRLQEELEVGIEQDLGGGRYKIC